jgi:hypothetical protein
MSNDKKETTTTTDTTEKPLTAWELQEIRQYGCCSKARRVFCVCRVKMHCPDHGSRCHGSHD